MDRITLTRAQKRVEHLKDQGDEKIKKGDAQTAIKFYSEAVDVMSEHSGIDEELEAKIWSNRSAAHIKMCNYRDALLDAKCAVTANPDWFKGYIRLSKAYEGLEEYSNSLKMHHTALSKLLETNASRSVFVETFISECCLICSIKEKDQPLATKYFNELAKSHGTEEMMNMLAVHDRFDLLLQFLKFKINDTMKATIKKMFTSQIKDKWLPNQEAVSITGLQSGTLELADFSVDSMMPPLFFAVQRGIESESTKLLEYLLRNHFTTADQVQHQNIDGRTIMDYLFFLSHKQYRTSSVKVLECLKSFGHVDLRMKNSQGHSVLESDLAESVPWLTELCKPKQINTPAKTTDQDKQSKANEVKGSAGKSKEKKDKTMTQKDLKERNEKLKVELEKLQNELKTLETQQKASLSGEANDNNKLVKCTIPDSDVKVEVPLYKLPDILEKLGVIKLH